MDEIRLPVPVSFEFFPPKSEKMEAQLWDAVTQLKPLAPSFVSVTYGAGGTTRKLTHEAVATIKRNYGLKVAAHLTCVDASRSETLEIAEAYAAAGVTEIVALRGDPASLRRPHRPPGGILDLRRRRPEGCDQVRARGGQSLEHAVDAGERSHDLTSQPWLAGE